ncbi:MAG: DUF2306 domain-containing protein [Polyangiaceae bacterium]
MTRFFSQLPRRGFLLFMLLGWGFIFASSLAYFDLGRIPEFMLEKLPLRFESLWLVSLRIHVAAALISLPLCIVLMTRALQRRPAIHRVLGRVAGMTLLFGLVPTGVVLAFDAKGGRFVTAGFLLSGAIVFACTVRGVLAARRGDLVTHQRAMRHVFAQMSVAVTSRALLMMFDVAGFDPDLAYVVALWGPVLGSALVVELLSLRGARLALLIERIRRELAPLALSIRPRIVARPANRIGR